MIEIIKSIIFQVEKNINSLASRERIILFSVIVLTFCAISDFEFISPSKNRHREILQKIAPQKAEMERLKAELFAMGNDSSKKPSDAMKDKAISDELYDVNRKISDISSGAFGGITLEDFLLQLLKNQDGLKLVSIKTLGSDGKDESKFQSDISNKDGVVRSGVIFRVSGSYYSLKKYAKSIEVSMPNLRWGQMTLSTDKKNPELSVQVYLIGISK